jgi:hypothetical protein
MWSEVSCLSQIKYALNFFAEKRILSDIYALKLLQRLEESSYFSFRPHHGWNFTLMHGFGTQRACALTDFA